MFTCVGLHFKSSVKLLKPIDDWLSVAGLHRRALRFVGCVNEGVQSLVCHGFQICKRHPVQGDAMARLAVILPLNGFSLIPFRNPPCHRHAPSGTDAMDSMPDATLRFPRLGYRATRLADSLHCQSHLKGCSPSTTDRPRVKA